MGWHIVRPLQGMFEIGCVLGDELVEVAFEIPANIGIGVLID